MAKQALPGSRLNMFGMDPWDVVVIGIDTDDGPEHPLAEDLERLKAPLDEPFVLDIMDQGVLEPIIVRKNGRVLKRAAEYDHNGGLHPEFVRALRWATGEIATNSVAGLAKLVKK